ncbi:hypothetical protein DFQ05_0047 [Winogradskyella wandonensis]|uniref:Uncharacterized protein n=1 Tax=Winogradskyella wandonensis TaxID=1442586 RepID=A0A4R1KVW1_9FLAO|nr:hypothetical protein [Winogradskyella wandonensis]TCK68539.1 hypothetical protein DFQ05_0047 [Winogradskyella wandonensis]
MQLAEEILLRLIVYPFCAFIFYLSWEMTFEPTHYPLEINNFKAKFYGPIGLIFSLIYPVTDILIGLKKLFKKNDNLK